MYTKNHSLFLNKCPQLIVPNTLSLLHNIILVNIELTWLETNTLNPILLEKSSILGRFLDVSLGTKPFLSIQVWLSIVIKMLIKLSEKNTTTIIRATIFSFSGFSHIESGPQTISFHIIDSYSLVEVWGREVTTEQVKRISKIWHNRVVWGNTGIFLKFEKNYCYKGHTDSKKNFMTFSSFEKIKWNRKKNIIFFSCNFFLKTSYIFIYHYVFLSFIHILETIVDSQVKEFFEKKYFSPKN